MFREQLVMEYNCLNEKIHNLEQENDNGRNLKDQLCYIHCNLNDFKSKYETLLPIYDDLSCKYKKLSCENENLKIQLEQKVQDILKFKNSYDKLNNEYINLTVKLKCIIEDFDKMKQKFNYNKYHANSYEEAMKKLSKIIKEEIPEIPEYPKPNN